MLHLRSLTGFSIDLECWNAFRLVNRINSERKVKQNLDIKVWVLWRSSRGHPENVLGTSQINFPGKSHGRHFRTSPGHQFGTSPERQTGTFRDGQIESLGDVLGMLERDVLGTSWGPIFADWNKNRCDCLQYIPDLAEKGICCDENPEAATVGVL